MKADVVIVGSGPAGIFTALELIKNGSKKKIIMVEKGSSIHKRNCPKSKTKKCVGCEPCNITAGFSGAGAFSDGKLSLSYEVGGDLPSLIGEDFAQSLIDYTDKIYLEFGADTHVEGINQGEKVKEIRKRAIQSGLKLVDCPIRHLGTEKAQEIYASIEDFLVEHGVEIMFGYTCEDIILEENKCVGIRIKKTVGVSDETEIYGDDVIIATGRRGAEWLEKLCAKYDIMHKPGTVDIGVRVEVRNEIMEDVNNVLYESKLIGYPRPFKNKVRTFCQNPGGFVSQENYDDNLAVVNGHSYKERKSTNTNLAILVSHHFTYPFNKPIDYGRNVAKNLNELGAGNILVQRLGDIYRGKRTWEQELKQNTVIPTLKSAVPGDITYAIGYRTMTDILNFIRSMDKVVEGFADPDNLLYAPEIKFYSNQVVIDNNFESNIKGLYSIGDGGGMTRGLMMASASGVQMARILAQKGEK